MSLILTQEIANDIPAPVVGKGTMFLTTTNQIAVKNSSGNTAVFATTSSSNTQVVYNQNGSLVGSSNLTFDGTTLTVNGFVSYGVNNNVSAAGSTQGTATLLTHPITVVNTVSNGANGVVMPTTVAGMRILIVNSSANTLNVYPASGGAINSEASNAAYSLAAGARLEFISTTSTQWYTLSST